jgi:hypothetical protein
VPTPDERTVSFEAWPILLLLEGPSASIGTLISMMYADVHVPRDSWTLEHTERSRHAYAEKLRRAGSIARRQGLGVRAEATAKIFEARAKALGLACTRFSGMTSPGNR